MKTRNHHAAGGRLLGVVAAAILACAGSGAADARPFTIKVATVAPKGSIYHRVLQEMGESWRAAQGGGARFIIYTDGSQGTEADTVRRLRVGQLQASMLTVSGLMEIEPAVKALQFMPMTFRTWREVDYVLDNIRPRMERRFEERGFKMLLWGVAGWVQFFSDEPRMMPEDFLDARIFTWAGTREQENIMKSLGYRPVVLDLPDVLPAVQTGMIDVVPAAPLWALAGQFYRDAPHMLRMNWVPIVGGTVLSLDTWNTMSPEARAALLEAATRAEETLRAHREQLDEGAIEAMQQRGLIVHEPTPEVEQAWARMAETLWPMIRGGLVPADVFDEVHDLIAAYRAERR
ncbi:MAG: TRAP transporter substrate-binding protein DctP [Gammaproteobacteria bacterium]|nr:TRAP transporter substrate-binding protein DctP [Gammaproteobacteria bacterium]